MLRKLFSFAVLALFVIVGIFPGWAAAQQPAPAPGMPGMMTPMMPMMGNMAQMMPLCAQMMSQTAGTMGVPQTPPSR